MSEHSWKPDRTYGRFSTQPFKSGDECLDGHALTPWGYVVAWTSSAGTAMRFVHNGREHCRVINSKQYSNRGLATICGRFAREIAEGGTPDD